MPAPALGASRPAPACRTESHRTMQRIQRAVLAVSRLAAAPLSDTIGHILVGVLDGVNAVPEMISGGAREQDLIKNVARTLTESASRHLADASAAEKRNENGPSHIR